MQEMLNSTTNKLTMGDDALKAMVITLKEETMATTRALNMSIEELEGELVVCRVDIGKGVLGVTLNRDIDVPKLKKFKGKGPQGNGQLLVRIE
ncbi:hypothetical protein J1N35_039665 [Gossypium stocksii]|uniref:Uncharacterized protein n=1 Tax=Gossypium stocksii TaxID=47602 RepID=A0A9D3UC66_9ROSI|nr:hypothetical protein J1N35_039665 [Gossypium stocksii]